MTTIPASQIVTVTPSVLSAGGSALDVIGLIISSNSRIPINSVQSFASLTDVENYFGASSNEAAIAEIYFAGDVNADKLPGSILFAQWPNDGAQAFLRGSSLASMTLTALQALSGSLTVTVDGFARTAANINLAGAASFSAAAGLIQVGLNGVPPTESQVTGSIASVSSNFNGSILGNVLTVTSAPSQPIVNGAALSGGSGVVLANTTVINQLSGVSGSIGTYAVNNPQVVSGTALTVTYGLLTVSAVTSGSIAVGQTVQGSGVSANTQVTELGTGTGLTGTYYVAPAQTVLSEGLTAIGTPVTVTYDTVSGGFVVTSGVSPGSAASTIGYASGTLAASLGLTQSTGAVTSQGSPALTPSVFMDGVVNVTQDWATFMLAFDPDMAQTGGPQKLQFAQWNTQKNDAYAFICWDADLSPTASATATQSLGQVIKADQISGTTVIYDTTFNTAAFICGAIASIDFEATDGRTTLAFRTSAAGFAAVVSSSQVSTNLLANGYNFYGAFATASQQFIFFWKGTISGPFQWLDSYIDQIWLNNLLLQALINLLTQVKSIPYNQDGSTLIEAALSDPINQAVDFGAIRAGVTLSALQVQEVNTAAGNSQAGAVLGSRGWYLQVKPPTPAVRQARGSPPCTFWYMDGQSVQQINLASVELQ